MQKSLALAAKMENNRTQIQIRLRYRENSSKGTIKCFSPSVKRSMKGTTLSLTFKNAQKTSVFVAGKNNANKRVSIGSSTIQTNPVVNKWHANLARSSNYEKTSEVGEMREMQMSCHTVAE